MGQNDYMKREARVCMAHGNPGYPRTIKCVICKALRSRNVGTPTPQIEPVAMNVCFHCWITGGAGTRCCEFETD